jgi:hypothetical protein
MTTTLGPGSRVRFIGYSGDQHVDELVVGCVYVVSDATEVIKSLCSCGTMHGLRLRGVETPRVWFTTNVWWCACGFRPADDGEQVLAELRAHLDVGAPTRRLEPA